MKIVIACLMILAVAGCKSTSNLKVVSGFDADRYLGVWYEAARYPHRFEDGLHAVSATYSKNENGTIKVENRGFDENKGQWNEIVGIAKLKDQADEGWLKVSFFKPFYASYKIIYLDENYTKAIVTGPTYGYLWLLTRTPDIPKQELNEMIEKAERFGFDSEHLITVDQSKNKI